MGGGKGSAPAAPDYSPVAQSSTEAAKIQAQTSQDQLDWAKAQYADQAPMTKAYMQSMVDTQAQDNQIQQQQMAIEQQNQQNAQEAQDYYKSTYQPMETQFAQTARIITRRSRRRSVRQQRKPTWRMRSPDSARLLCNRWKATA